MRSLVGPFAITLSPRALAGQAFTGLLGGAVAIYLCVVFTPIGSIRQFYGRVIAATLLGGVVTGMAFIGLLAVDFAPAGAGKTWEQLVDGQGALLQVAAVAEQSNQRSWPSIIIVLSIFQYLLLLGHMLTLRR
jgi:NO-binding membrane sensor protein with MHYT domain